MTMSNKKFIKIQYNNFLITNNLYCFMDIIPLIKYGNINKKMLLLNFALPHLEIDIKRLSSDLIMVILFHSSN